MRSDTAVLLSDGRFNSAFQLLPFGVMPLGAALGLRTPFLAGGVALLAIALVGMRVGDPASDPRGTRGKPSRWVGNRV